jgi:hypothetical protein
VQRFEDMVPRRADCEGCGEPLHCCRNCTFYDSSAYNECREPSAERVVDKVAANFCDFFQSGASAPKAAAQAPPARDELERLFKKTT